MTVKNKKDECKNCQAHLNQNQIYTHKDIQLKTIVSDRQCSTGARSCLFTNYSYITTVHILQAQKKRKDTRI